MNIILDHGSLTSLQTVMTIKVAQLAKSANTKLTDLVIGSIVAITDEFLLEDYKKKLLVFV